MQDITLQSSRWQAGRSNRSAQMCIGHGGGQTIEQKGQERTLQSRGGQAGRRYTTAADWQLTHSGKTGSGWARWSWSGPDDDDDDDHDDDKRAGIARAEQEGAGRLNLLNSIACGSCHGGGRTGSGCAHRSRQGLMMMMM